MEFTIKHINLDKAFDTEVQGNPIISESSWIFNWLASLVGVDNPSFTHRGLIVKLFKERYLIVRTGNNISLIAR